MTAKNMKTKTCFDSSAPLCSILTVCACSSLLVCESAVGRGEGGVIVVCVSLSILTGGWRTWAAGTPSGQALPLALIKDLCLSAEPALCNTHTQHINSAWLDYTTCPTFNGAGPPVSVYVTTFGQCFLTANGVTVCTLELRNETRYLLSLINFTFQSEHVVVCTYVILESAIRLH